MVTLRRLVLALGAAWVVGMFASDRWWWSQWLCWIPAAAVLCAAIPVAIGGSGRRTERVLCWSLACMAAVRVALHDWGWAAWNPPAGCLRVAQFNAQWPGEEAAAMGEPLAALEWDILAVSNPGSLFREPAAWVPEGCLTVHVGCFAVVSRVPIERVHLDYASVGATVATVSLRPAAPWDGPLTLMMVDLPSSPRLGRMASAEALRASLASLRVPSPDIALGDFNMTDGAAALTLFPDTRDAFTPWLGTGFAGTFPSALPLWRIDQVRHGSRIRSLGCTSSVVGNALHRAQVALLAPADQ